MQKLEQHEITAVADSNGLRLDQFIASRLINQSRSYIQKLIKNGGVTVNEQIRKTSYTVRAADKIKIILPEVVQLEAGPEDIPLKILYEDASLLVVDKPAGLVVHPGAGHFNGTLVNALLYHCGGSLSGIGGVMRPGIVHRLDRYTSGCIVVAKTDEAHNDLSRQFEERLVKKEYMALVGGDVKDLKKTITANIGRHKIHRKKMAVKEEDEGREAVTTYELVERYHGASLLRINLGTGRTHQIRVHMAHIGHPILGDEEYGKKKSKIEGVEIGRQMLHAQKIGFTHPVKKGWVEFISEIPEDMTRVIEFLKKDLMC